MWIAILLLLCTTLGLVVCNNAEKLVIDGLLHSMEEMANTEELTEPPPGYNDEHYHEHQGVHLYHDGNEPLIECIKSQLMGGIELTSIALQECTLQSDDPFDEDTPAAEIQCAHACITNGMVHYWSCANHCVSDTVYREETIECQKNQCVDEVANFEIDCMSACAYQDWKAHEEM